MREDEGRRMKGGAGCVEEEGEGRMRGMREGGGEGGGRG